MVMLSASLAIVNYIVLKISKRFRFPS